MPSAMQSQRAREKRKELILGFVSLNVEENSSDFFIVEEAVKSYSDKTRAARVFRFFFQFQFLAKASESSPAAQNKLPVGQTRGSTFY
jgi:hypothetical protein